MNLLLFGHEIAKWKFFKLKLCILFRIYISLVPMILCHGSYLNPTNIWILTSLLVLGECLVDSEISISFYSYSNTCLSLSFVFFFLTKRNNNLLRKLTIDSSYSINLLIIIFRKDNLLNCFTSHLNIFWILKLYLNNLNSKMVIFCVEFTIFVTFSSDHWLGDTVIPKLWKHLYIFGR